MKVWRLSSKRLAAPTFFVYVTPELPLPLTMDSFTKIIYRKSRYALNFKQVVQVLQSVVYHC